MRSRWFHAPTLHTDRDPPRRVSWLELFYDLIFVAAIIQIGDALSQDVGGRILAGSLAVFAVHFVPLWTAWTGFTFYANRYDVDDFVHRNLVLAQMFAVGAIGIAAPLSMDPVDPRPAPFALAYAAAQGLLAVMYWRSWKHGEEGREYAVYWGGIFAAGAVLWGLSALVTPPLTWLLWAIGALLVLASPLHARSRELRDRFPLDMQHLTERYGLLVIIVLGESFVKVLGQLTAHEYGLEPQYLAKGAFVLTITCCVWWIYFDDVAGSRIREGRGSWVIWLFGHLPLTGAITASGVAVKHAVTLDLHAPPDLAYRWLLCGSLSATFLSVAMIDAVTERRQAELSDTTRVQVRAASALTLLLVGQVGGSMAGGTFLGLVTAVGLVQVIFDMVMAPLEETAMIHEARNLAEVARSRAEGRERVVAQDPRAAVRKGMPSELRSDLYFFFMDATWTQVLLLASIGYIASNAIFASLYLLDDQAILGEGAHTFAQAFAFSVQTMSTIGYGALSPGSPWGHLLVTVESAYAMLVVALTTGLMFAKAARPSAKVLFSDHPVITTWDGRKTLMLRAGNARGNELVEASVTLVAMVDHITAEVAHIRRLVDLPLVRGRSPIFALTWTIQHVIDEQSPLHGCDWHAPTSPVLGLIVTLFGHDGTLGQQAHARQIYRASDIRPGHKLVDVMSQLPDGRMMIDYDHFHDTEPE